MSSLDDLVTRLAPRGVAYRRIGDIAEVGTGSGDRKDADENGQYPFYVRSKDVLRSGTYQFDEDAIVIPGEGGIGEIFHFVSGKYSLHQRAYRISFHTPEVDTRFAYYVFSAQFKRFILQKAVSATVTSIRKPMVTDFRIPVPPLEIQREIVGILDQFTELEEELKSQLAAELKARRAQYGQYLHEVLSFRDDDARWMTLGEIGRVAMCKRVFKSETTETGDIPFFKIGTFGGTADAFISRELFDDYRSRYSFPKPGDVLISAAGTIGRAIQYDGEPAYFQDSNIVWIDNDESVVSNAYLKTWYRVITWSTDGGTIQRLYNENIRRARIAVPPLDRQERIVAHLDRFDALVNDLTSGLHAELAARRKQYEHYRDKLLTFEETAA